jgi:hypothetical protein
MSTHKNELLINISPSSARPGTTVVLEIMNMEYIDEKSLQWTVTDSGGQPVPHQIIAPSKASFVLTSGGSHHVVALAKSGLHSNITLSGRGTAEVEAGSYIRGDVIPVSLHRAEVVKTDDIVLWALISHGTQAISFGRYKDFIDGVMCGREGGKDGKIAGREFRSSLPFPGVDPYNLLKTATEVFMMGEVGVRSDLSESDLQKELWQEANRLGERFGRREAHLLLKDYLVDYHSGGNTKVRTLPYLKLIADRMPEVGLKPAIGGGEEAANCYGILRDKLHNPCFIELIWSYWQEEGMLVQAMNAISLRFQNRRSAGDIDALGRLDLDALRPMGNLMWGYIQDEQHRLTVVRRAYEYDHQYGLTLVGKAVRNFRPADSRSKFLEAFHNLISKTAQFYLQDDDTTFIADGYPLLNAIREVHLVLAEGAHNQFGDLPTTSRQEMLMQQWLLARPEMREFLGGRIMVPYPEPWMDRVDTVKKLSGWTDTIVTHFYELAVYGERLLLSTRYGNWSDVNYTGDQAANWARYWRPEVQGYLHAYRAVTGVDLSSEAPSQSPMNGRSAQPSVLLQKRLALQNSRR